MPAVIEQPILNSPFQEPARHYRFAQDGITDEIVVGRRPSTHFIPIPQPRKKGAQQTFDTHWTEDREQATGSGKTVVMAMLIAWLQERGDASRLTKTLLGQRETGAFTETPPQMVHRVCRELGAKGQIVVLNDEAHHCYRGKPLDPDERLTGEEKSEASRRNEEARLWMTGLEDLREVVRYAKNHNLGFTIPYTLDGEEHQYIPDYLVCLDEGRRPADLLNLVLEVSGEARKDRAAKVAAARELWVPAVNNHGGFGRWAFLEVTDPWNAASTIRRILH